MPTYDYECLNCGDKFEAFQPITADPRHQCEKCHGRLRRLIGGGGAVMFKGSGFYETDYKRQKPAPPSPPAARGGSPPKKIDNSPPTD